MSGTWRSPWQLKAPGRRNASLHTVMRRRFASRKSTSSILSRWQIGPLVSVDYFNGRITTIQGFVAGTSRPADVVVIDGEGGTLIPGLHDMHTHTTAADTGLFYLAAGVTTVRDMGNDNAQLAGLAAQFADGSLAGPHVIANGLIEGRSPYSARMGIIADSESQALAAVDWYAERGYFQIKIYNSVRPEWDSPNRR